MNIYWKGVIVIYSEEDRALLIKRPEDKEGTELKVYNIEVHNYEDVEDEARDLIDFKELWKDAVYHNYTELWYDDWYEDNDSNEVENYISGNRDLMWYEVADYDCYRELRNGDNNCQDIYYEAQCELKEEKTFDNYNDFELWFIENTDVDSSLEYFRDSELWLEILQYFNKDEYVAVL